VVRRDKQDRIDGEKRRRKLPRDYLLAAVLRQAMYGRRITALCSPLLRFERRVSTMLSRQPPARS
jgi:hypothetical protein